MATPLNRAEQLRSGHPDFISNRDSQVVGQLEGKSLEDLTANEIAQYTSIVSAAVKEIEADSKF